MMDDQSKGATKVAVGLILTPMPVYVCEQA